MVKVMMVVVVVGACLGVEKEAVAVLCCGR